MMMLSIVLAAAVLFKDTSICLQPLSPFLKGMPNKSVPKKPRDESLMVPNSTIYFFSSKFFCVLQIEIENAPPAKTQKDLVVSLLARKRRTEDRDEPAEKRACTAPCRDRQKELCGRLEVVVADQSALAKVLGETLGEVCSANEVLTAENKALKTQLEAMNKYCEGLLDTLRCCGVAFL